MARTEILSGYADEDGSPTSTGALPPTDHRTGATVPAFEADLVLDDAEGGSSPRSSDSQPGTTSPPRTPQDGTPRTPSTPNEPRQRLVTVLAGCLAASLALVVALTGALVTSAWTAGDQAQVADLIEEYSRAVTAHDIDAVRATLTQYAAFAAGERPDRPRIGPVRGVRLDDALEGLFRASVSLSTTGSVEITGDGPYQVTAQQTVTYVSDGVAVHEEGVSLYSVVLIGDRPLIARHVWWRPLDSSSPAMPALVSG